MVPPATASVLLPRDGQPHPAPLLVDDITSKPPWPTYSTSWATTSVGSSSSTPSARAVINLSVPAEELGAPRWARLPAACGRPGYLGLSGSGLMPRVPCVLRRPGTHCIVPVYVCAAVVCMRFWVLTGRRVSVPLVCDQDGAGAAVRCCGWSPRQGSRPRSCWGRPRAPWACGVTWDGRIASRLCPNRVRVRTASGRKF